MDYSKLKVLIVDDVPSARKVARATLIKLGFTDIQEASCGKEALKLIKQRVFNLVISDWEMPDLNGLELLRQLRSDSWAREVRFIMVTSNASRDEVLSALKSGVNGYLVKPFNPDTFRQEIEKVLESPG